MVGRNFWVEPKDGGWIVREEGLPDQTTSHGSREDAWAAANERAASCQGEAFLTGEDGAIEERKWHGIQPRDFKPV